MRTLIDRAFVMTTIFALFALATAAPAAAQEKQQDQQPDARVTLSAKDGSSVHGTALIRDIGQKGDMDAHRVQVRLRDLQPDETYRVHLHRGTCEAGGPVLLGLNSVQGDQQGRGSSTTTVSARKLAERMKSGETAKKGDTSKTTGGAETVRQSLFVQAHLPGGTPAACGEVPRDEMKQKGQSMS